MTLKEKIIKWLALMGAVVHLVIFLLVLLPLLLDKIWYDLTPLRVGILLVQFLIGLLALSTAILCIKKKEFRYAIYSLALLVVMNPLNTLSAAGDMIFRETNFMPVVFYASLLSIFFIVAALVLLALRDKPPETPKPIDTPDTN